MENTDETQVELWNDMKNMEERQVELWKDLENTPRAAAAAAAAAIYPRAAAAAAAIGLKFHPKTRDKQKQNETHYENITH